MHEIAVKRLPSRTVAKRNLRLASASLAKSKLQQQAAKIHRHSLKSRRAKRGPCKPSLMAGQRRYTFGFDFFFGGGVVGVVVFFSPGGRQSHLSQRSLVHSEFGLCQKADLVHSPGSKRLPTILPRSLRASCSEQATLPVADIGIFMFSIF